MKKIILFLSLFLLCSCTEKIENIQVETVKTTTDVLHAKQQKFEYGELYKMDELFDNNDIAFTKKWLDVSNLGSNVIDIEYTLNGETYIEKFPYEVIDTTSPLLYISGSYTMYVDDEDDLVNRVICADNQDRTPNCYIEGDYDLQKVGTYPLTYVGIDNQGNKETADFKLIVKSKDSKPKGGSQSSGSNGMTPIQNIIDKYKTEETMIGIDVSKYQGDINWQEVKNAGVEFAMIRLGLGWNEVTKYDEKFVQNIEGALANDIEVGIYFYSYATTLEEIELEAKFVLDTIKDYNVTFPIAFDWENFTGWNEYGISLFDVRNMNNTFADFMQEKNYQTVQYGSKNSLRNFWSPIRDDIWLAFYIKEGQTQDFEKPIKMWQICNNGRVPGINGDVDIDIYYK